MRRPSLTDSIPDLEMPEFPHVPEDTVEVLTDYLLRSLKTKEQIVANTPVVEDEPTIPQEPTVSENPEVTKSAWVSGWEWRSWTLDDMMTSSNGNIFRVTGPLCGEFTGQRWIPLSQASDAEFWCLLWSAPEQTAE